MSYSFLSDAFPSWQSATKDQKGEGTLFENFEADAAVAVAAAKPQIPKNHPTPRQQASSVHPDKDLLTESFTDYNLPLETNRGPGPQPFDSTSDYFKLLSNDWNKDMAKYQATARLPFGPKDYSGEEAQHAGGGCMNIAKHIDQCADCRKRLEGIFRKLFMPPATPTTTTTANKKQNADLFSNLADVLLLVGIGLFVIFILDGFVKLGRYFRS